LLGEGVLDDLRSEKPEYRVEFEGVISQETRIAMEKGGLLLEPGLVTMPTSKASEVQPVIDHLRNEGLVISRVEKRTQSLEELFMGFVDQSQVATPPPIPGGAVAQPPALPNS